MSRLTSLQTASLPQRICEAICAAAARGDFLPNEKLVEADLARELGVSRVPVREALRLLESQGLVVSEPYKGMRLMSVSTQDCRHRFSVYRALAFEALGIIEEARAIDPRWQDLHAAIADARAAAVHGDKSAVAHAVQEFFNQLFGSTGNGCMLTIVQRLHVQFSLYVSLFSSDERLVEFPSYLGQAHDAIMRQDFPVARTALAHYLDPDQVGDVEHALEAAWERRDAAQSMHRFRIGAFRRGRLRRCRTARHKAEGRSHPAAARHGRAVHAAP